VGWAQLFRGSLLSEVTSGPASTLVYVEWEINGFPKFTASACNSLDLECLPKVRMWSFGQGSYCKVGEPLRDGA
jgi:hypothetical protein